MEGPEFNPSIRKKKSHRQDPIPVSPLDFHFPCLDMTLELMWSPWDHEDNWPKSQANMPRMAEQRDSKEPWSFLNCRVTELANTGSTLYQDFSLGEFTIPYFFQLF
jgi:hypothetical protein